MHLCVLIDRAVIMAALLAPVAACASAASGPAAHAPSGGSMMASAAAQTAAQREAAIIATYLEFAARRYSEAVSSPRSEPYLDGFRYYESAALRFETQRTVIASENRTAASAIADALVVFGQAFRSPGRPATLTADPVALNAAATRVRAAAGSH